MLTISFLLLVTLIVVCTLPSPQANAQGDEKAGITPSINPSQESQTSITPQVSKEPEKMKQRSPQDPTFAQKAKEKVEKDHHIAKETLQVVTARDAYYPFSGKKAHTVKLIDEKGTIYRMTLDDTGEVVDDAALAQEDMDARHAKYGKFDPGFYEKLSKGKDDMPVDASIALKIPQYDPLPRPDITFPDGGNNPSLDELEKLRKKEQELYDTHFQPILQAAREKFKTKGYDFSQDTDGVFSIKMSFKELQAIQEWEEISDISDGTAKLTAALASARPASGITAVNKRNSAPRSHSSPLINSGFSLAGWSG